MQYFKVKAAHLLNSDSNVLKCAFQLEIRGQSSPTEHSRIPETAGWFQSNQQLPQLVQKHVDRRSLS